MYIHPEFKWNDKSYNANDLECYSTSLKTSLIEEERSFSLFVLQWLNKECFVEVFTSGTTGDPKKIKVEKKAMIASAQATGNFFSLKSKDTALLCLPLNYIAGKMMLVRAMVLGLHLEGVVPSLTPLNFIDKSYDFVAMTPLQVQNSLKNITKCKTLIIGGASLHNNLKIELNKTNINAYETYGMTETVSHIALKKSNENVFKTLADVTLSTDSRGCLVIDAPKLCKQQLITNDLVNLINNYSFEWKGRVDHVINSGGVKIIPEQVERKLTNFIPHRYFIIGKEDEFLGQKVVLVIESSTYEIDPNIFDLLDRFEKPKEIIFKNKFIETPTGKIKRAQTLYIS